MRDTRATYPNGFGRIGLGLVLASVLGLGLGKMLGLIGPSILLVQIAILSAMGGMALWWALRSREPYYAPVLFALLFLGSYPMRILDLEFNPETQIAYSIGSFPFTVGAYWALLLVAAVGMAGIFLGVALGRLLLRPWVHQGRLRRLRMVEPTLGRLESWIWLWFAVSLGANLVAQKFGIGAFTLTPVVLPFKLSAFLLVIRPYLFPLVGLWLFGLALQQNSWRGVIEILLMNAGLGIISIVTTLSKGAAFYPFVPYALCLWMLAKRSTLSRSLFKWTLITMLILAPVSIIGASWMRLYTLRYGERPSLSELGKGRFGVADVLVDGSFLDTVFTHTFRRELGACEAMAVLSGKPLDLRGQLSLAVCSSGWTDVQSEAIYNVFGFNDFDSRAGGIGPVTGKGFGLFGFCYLSHHLPILFIGTLLVALFVILVEGFVLRLGNAGLSAGIGFTLTDLFWGASVDIIPWFVLNAAIVFIGSYLWQRRLHWRLAAKSEDSFNGGGSEFDAFMGKRGQL